MTETLTPKQLKKKLRDQFYSINVDLNKSVKKMFEKVDAESMTEVFGAYMQIVGHKDPGEEDISVDPQTLQQMAMLAAQALSRQITERYK